MELKSALYRGDAISGEGKEHCGTGSGEWGRREVSRKQHTSWKSLLLLPRGENRVSRRMFPREAMLIFWLVLLSCGLGQWPVMVLLS